MRKNHEFSFKPGKQTIYLDNIIYMMLTKKL